MSKFEEILITICEVGAALVVFLMAVLFGVLIWKSVTL